MLNLPSDYTGPITTAPLGPFPETAPDLRSLWCTVVLGQLFPFYLFVLMGVIVDTWEVYHKATNAHVQLSSFNSTPYLVISV